jgi:hypothetical protein
MFPNARVLELHSTGAKKRFGHSGNRTRGLINIFSLSEVQMMRHTPRPSAQQMFFKNFIYSPHDKIGIYLVPNADILIHVVDVCLKYRTKSLLHFFGFFFFFFFLVSVLLDHQ